MTTYPHLFQTDHRMSLAGIRHEAELAAVGCAVDVVFCELEPAPGWVLVEVVVVVMWHHLARVLFSHDPDVGPRLVCRIAIAR